MKKNLFWAVSIITLSVSTAAYAITVTGTAKAVIKAAITANEVVQMNFGTISSAATPGTVILSPAGVASSSTNDLYNTTNAGAFSITAEKSTPLTISFAGGNLTSGANSMTISNFTSNPASPASTDAGGSLSLNVGATLAVGANQTSGNYAGTYSVTLSY